MQDTNYWIFTDLEKGSFTPQLSGLLLALLSIFINDFDEDIDGLVVKYVGDTKLEEIANTLDSRIAMQRRCDRLKQRTISNTIMFNGDKCKVQHLVKINKQIKWNKQQRDVL